MCVSKTEIKIVHLMCWEQLHGQHSTVYATIPERSYAERAASTMLGGIKLACNPRQHEIILRILAQQKIVQLWHGL